MNSFERDRDGIDETLDLIYSLERMRCEIYDFEDYNKAVMVACLKKDIEPLELPGMLYPIVKIMREILDAFYDVEFNSMERHSKKFPPFLPPVAP